MMTDLSPQQATVLATIREHGGTAIPTGGGYWTCSDGHKLDFPNMTQTIYSLKNKLKLKRLAVHPEAWRDHYVLADL